MSNGKALRRLVAVIGVPPEIKPQFSSSFSKLAAREQVELTMLSAYGLHLPYTMDYATEVYGKIASKLKGHQRPSRETLLADTYLIALFLQKPCESHRVLLDTFGIETLATHVGVQSPRHANGDQQPTRPSCWQTDPEPVRPSVMLERC